MFCAVLCVVLCVVLPCLVLFSFCPVCAVLCVVLSCLALPLSCSRLALPFVGPVLPLSMKERLWKPHSYYTYLY